MKNNKWLKLAGIVSSLGLAVVVQATPITGGIGLSGTFSDNASGNLSTATSLTILTSSLDTRTGSFVGGTLSTALFSPISVNPAGNLVANVLWRVTVGGTIYTFTVTGETQGATTSSSLALSGTGMVTDNAGDAAVAGLWQLNFGTLGGNFTWQNTTGVIGVPDGGTTVLLLGAALSGLGLLRRKLIA